MRGKVCAVFDCSNYEVEKNARSFFRFPRDKNMCDLWVMKCHRSDLDKVYKKEGTLRSYKNYKICSDHFQASDFKNPRLYSQGSRMIDIQVQMSERAVELLALPDDSPCYLLDLGCGSGLSGSVLEDQGHTWVGIDISTAMLEVAVEREVEGDLVLGDLGQGVPFRAGAFDGAVSISALQWLCNADKKTHNPVKRLYAFFSSLFAALSRTGRAVFQFYPENNEQVELVTAQAMKAGFFGGIVVDYPNSTKAKKFFLVLMTGGAMPMPKALGGPEDGQNGGVSYTSKREQMKKMRGKPLKRSREWILEKKERRRRQGKDVRADTKYTGRKRSGRF